MLHSLVALSLLNSDRCVVKVIDTERVDTRVFASWSLPSVTFMFTLPTVSCDKGFPDYTWQKIKTRSQWLGSKCKFGRSKVNWKFTYHSAQWDPADSLAWHLLVLQDLLHTVLIQHHQSSLVQCTLTPSPVDSTKHAHCVPNCHVSVTLAGGRRL